ncbi:MAG: flagellar export chaperone FliS [Magnetococcales bacterium]|nr:flagellar export chaperone FliS [Magnetococcales bacterium]
MNMQLAQTQRTPVIPSGLDILIQLYEGCIIFLKEAEEACENGRVDDFKDRLLRGRRIIEHFQKTLDYEQGGQVPKQLNELYTFMLDSLTQSSLTHDTDYIQRVVEQLEILLDGWRGARPSTLS